MTREIPEFDVTEHPDGTFEARRTGTPASAPADATAATFHELEMECLAVRVAWLIAPDWRDSRVGE
ncbi:hypothetical protein ACQPYK_17085 [Streptosporangium sp. CA-135522]|uniref:hypothetical protein n=1 Tax=Streptosporangium sp. CA-135522 TaxID=3240072 RepID=UPI003D8FCD74